MQVKFKLHIELTDKDYLDYNLFQTLKSPYGAQTVLGLRILLTVIVLFFVTVSVISGGFSAEAFIGIIPMLLLLAVLQLIIVPLFGVMLKWQIKTMSKFGKAGYAPITDMEFFEDRFTETTPDEITERKYSAVERISVIDGKIIYLHTSNVGAYLIPCASFESTEQCDEFIGFMKTKCSTVDIYPVK